jgi:hypothetical protein
MGDGDNVIAFPTVSKHLGHERHAIDAAVPIQCRENFFLASHFDQVTRAKSRNNPSHRPPQ